MVSSNLSWDFYCQFINIPLALVASILFVFTYNFCNIYFFICNMATYHFYRNIFFHVFIYIFGVNRLVIFRTMPLFLFLYIYIYIYIYQGVIQKIFLAGARC